MWNEKKKKRKVQSHKYGCFLTVSLGAKSLYHSKLPHLSLINIYTRWAVMNANLFAFFSLLTSPWAEGSWEKVCRLTGSEDISVSQPSGILISGGESSFHRNWRALSALGDAAGESVQAAGVLPSLKVDVRAGKQCRLQKTAFLYGDLSNLGLMGEAGRSGCLSDF